SAGQIKSMLRHAVHPGKNRSHVAENWQEAGSKHEFAAVPDEQILADRYPSFGQANMVAVLRQKLVTEPSADPVPDEVSQNCAKNPDRNQKPDIELMRRARKYRSRHQG